MNLLMKQEIHATTVRIAFSYFRENNIQLREKKANLRMSHDSLERLFR